MLAELKTAKNRKVEIRPHQASFFLAHAHGPVWLIVETQDSIVAYKGRKAVDVAEHGLDVPPDFTVANNGDGIGELFLELDARS